MTTATTNTIIDHTSDAAFRVWVQEVITLLVTTLGLTQTADTGQINTSTVTRPATNTSGGYVILRFNDTAQSTSPIFFKLEFGTGQSANSPYMWITMGTSSNGSGTINGISCQRSSVTPNSNIPIAIITPYVTRACYNTTAGFLGFVWKNGGFASGQNMGGFFIMRSADATGAVTTDAVQLICNTGSITGQGTSTGFSQVISQLTGLAYSTTTPWPTNLNNMMPFNLVSTLFSGNGSVGPFFQYTPVLGITPWCALALINELGVGSTSVMTLIGSTSHTYISVGNAFGGGTIGFLALSTTPGTSQAVTVMMLWE